MFCRISVNETTRSLTLTVLRDKGVFGNVSVFCFAQSVGDQATLGKDFTFSSLDIDFAQGESRKTITVQLFDDDIAEPDEQFEIILASPKGGLALGIPSKGKLCLVGINLTCLCHITSITICILSEKNINADHHV